MWTSECNCRRTVQEPEAEFGLVTLGGDPAGVLLGGERRWLPVYSPGGYCWRPAAGDRVLVLKTGAERETPCVLGAVQKNDGLSPGEVQLSGGNCSLRLGWGGLELNGTVLVNGQTLEKYVSQIVADLLSAGGGG